MAFSTSNHHLIVGPGAIGSLVCQHLQAQFTMNVWPHKPSIHLPKALIIGDHRYLLNWHLLCHPAPTLSIIWVCCKSTQVMHSLPDIMRRFPKAIAVLLHNGMGPQHQLTKLFPGRVIAGTTTSGAFAASTDTIQLAASGTTLLGTLDRRPSSQQQAVIDLCQRTAGIMNFQQASNIETTLWNKVTANAVINPITAYYQIANGLLLHAPYLEEVKRLCADIDSLSRELGFVESLDLFDRVKQIATLTQHNRSSMHQDIALGRPTEIDTITGYLLQTAEAQCLELPRVIEWHQRIVRLQQPSTREQ